MAYYSPELRRLDKWRDLPTRAFNALWDECQRRGWPFTIASVMGFTEAELLRLPNIGPKSVRDVREWLGRRRLALCGEQPWVMEAKPEAPVADLVAVLRRRLARAEARARDAEGRARVAAEQVSREKQWSRRRDRDFAYYRAEAKRKHSGVRREIERLRDGHHHLLPALASLQRHIEGQLPLLAAGQVTVDHFRMNLNDNFNEYRFYAGMPTTARPWEPPLPPGAADYTIEPQSAARH